MNSLLVLLGIVPIIIFVLVSFYGDYKAGIWAAIGTGVAVLLAIVALTGEIDETIVLEMALIVIFGIVSLKMKNPLYFNKHWYNNFPMSLSSIWGKF